MGGGLQGPNAPKGLGPLWRRTETQRAEPWREASGRSALGVRPPDDDRAPAECARRSTLAASWRSLRSNSAVALPGHCPSLHVKVFGDCDYATLRDSPDCARFELD